jgi:hypothetical protein
MNRRKALIKALIHFHHRTTTVRWGMKRKEPILRKLRSKIAEKDQYK